MKVWLDDERTAPEGWKRVHTVSQAMTHLALTQVSHLSLDHDLGENQPTGYDLCKWMAQYEHWPTEGISIHSMNPVGCANMKAVINRYSPFHID